MYNYLKKILFILFLLPLPCTFAAVVTSIQSGNWSLGTTWDGGTPPTSTDDVIIAAGHVVTVNVNAVINNLTINTSGELSNGNNKSITINGNYTVNGIHSGSGNIFLYGLNSRIDGTGSITNTKTITIGTGNKIIMETCVLSISNAITINNGIVVINYGTITLTGAVTGGNAASTWVNESGATLKISNTFLTTGTLTATATNNLVEYNLAGNQTIKNPSTNTYYHLKLSGSGTKTLSANVVISGNLTMSSTLDVSTTNYSITLYGDFINSGGIFTRRSGTVTFTGSLNQQINCTNDETFYNLTINKSSGSVSLNNNVIVDNILNLTNGYIITNSNILTLGTGVASIGTLSYTAGWIIGKFQRWLNATATPYTMPIGIEAYSRPVVITFTNLTAGSLIAEFISSDPKSSGLPLKDVTDSVFNTFPEGYWSLTAANGLASNSYNLELTGNGFTSFVINSRIRLLTRANALSVWTASGNHVSASGYTAKRNAISILSAQYCFGDTTHCNKPITSAISGSGSVCINASGVLYSVINTPGSTYSWSVTGGTVALGQGLNSITVDWGATGMNGTVAVVESNNCGSGSVVSKNVIINPLPVTEIFGRTKLAANTTNELYYVTARAGYTYSWSITGGNIASGQYNDSVYVNWGDKGTGNVRCIAVNDCGNSSPFDLEVTIYDVIKSVQTGNWGTASTWNCNCIPTTTDNVIIDASHTVSLSANTTVNNLIINNTATLSAGNRRMFVTGNFTNNGSYTGTSDLTFSGSEQIIDGTGTISKSGTIYFSNGKKTIAATAVFNVNSSNLQYSTAGLTIMNYGTVNLTGSIIGNDATSTWLNASNSTLKIGGALLATGVLNASSIGNTVNYNGSVAQNIKTPVSSTYYNLSITGSNTKTLTGAIIINGNLSISSTLDISTTNYAITIAGNWTNTGAFTERSGTVTFNGTQSQIISNAAIETFYNFNLNKTSDTLILANNVVISNTLTLIQGLLKTNSNKLTLGTSTANVGTLSYSNGRIIGKFERWLASVGVANLFPIGSNSYYRPITITCINLTAGSLISEFIPTNPGYYGFPIIDAGDTVYNTFSEGYWVLTAANGLVSNNYNLQLTGNGFTSYTITGATRIVKRISTSAPWLANGTHVVPSGNTAKRNGMSGFGNYAFSDTTHCPVPITSAILGVDSVCINTLAVPYSVTNNPENIYSWTITGGTQASGGNTNSITVNWGNIGTYGKVQVNETSHCGIGPTVEKNVTIHSLPTSSITGRNSVCEYTLNEPYSVVNNPGYIYTWIIEGGTKVSGGNTNSITVNWGAQGTGKIKVVATTSCSNADTVSITVSILGAIKTITSGNWNSPSTWECNCIPSATDNVSIETSHTVTLDANDTIANIAIKNGGVLDNQTFSLMVTQNYSNNGTHTGSGNIILSGNNTIISGTGTITNSGELQITSGNKSVAVGTSLSKTNGNIRIDNNLTLTNNGTLTVAGNIIGNNSSSTFINEPNASLLIGGDLLSTGTLIASATGNTVNYNGSLAQNIKAPSTSYYNLSISGSNIKTMTSNLTILGNLSISSTLDASTSNYNISLAGNWINTGTFTSRNGRVTFNGTVNQTINKATGETFYNLTINKNSGSLSLAGNITITNNLALTKGNTSCNSYTVTLGTSTSNTGTITYTSGYFIGRFKRWINTTGTAINFYIGTTYSRLTKITFTNLTPGALTVQYTATNSGNNGLPLTDGVFIVDSTFTEGYWILTASDGLASTNYALELTGTGFTSRTFTAATRLLKRSSSSSPWTVDGNHVAASGSIVKRSALSGFSEFAFGDTAACPGPATSTISGLDTVCKSTAATYLVTNHPSNTYTWTVIGGTIASGQGTNSINVNWGGTGRTDAVVRVVETDACKSGNPVDKNVVIHPIPTSDIIGRTTVDVNETGVTYSVTNTAGYTYTWSLANGRGTINSGQGTNSIVVNWGSIAGTDTVKVVASNGCGSVAIKKLTVTINSVISSLSSGQWNNITTWDCSCIPGTSSTVKIKSLHTITTTSNVTIKKLTIEKNGALDNNYSFTITGDLIMNGVYSGTGDLNLSGNNTTIDGTGTISNTGILRIQNGNKTIASTANIAKSQGGDVRILSDITLTNNGNLTIGGNLVGMNAGSTVINNDTLELRGAVLTTGTLIANKPGNVVNYYGDSTQVVKPTQYYTLTTTPTTKVELTQNLITSGDMKITGLFNTNNYNITVSGNWVNTGTFNVGTSKVIFNGSNTQNIDNGGQPFNDVEILGSGSKVLQNTTIINGTLTNSAPLDVGGNNTLTIKGNWVNNGGFNPRSGTVVFDGNTTLSGNVKFNFHNIIINNSKTVNTPLNDSLTITGNFTNNGNFNSNNSSVNFSGNTTLSGTGATSFKNIYINGSLTGNPSANLSVSGNWVNRGTFIHNNNTVKFIGSGRQYISNLTGKETFNNLIIDKPSKAMSTVVVPPTQAIIVNGTLTVNDSLILQSNASSTAQLLDNGTINGSGIMVAQCFIPNQSWHYVSPPVANATGAAFVGAGKNIYEYDEPNRNWKPISTSDVLGVMKGYNVYLPWEPKLENFVGPFNTGDKSIVISNSGDGWNLVGNPYPSAIDWDATSGWTKDNIVNAIYIWNHVTNNFAVYAGGIGINGGSRYIAPMQGFWVSTFGPGNGLLAVNNNVRVIDTVQFLKNKTSNILTITVTGNSYSDQTVIRFNEQATDNFDSQYDIIKKFSYDYVPQIYTVSNDAKQLSINSIPFNYSYRSIPLSFKVNVPASYKLTLSGVESLSNDLSIYLEDKKTGIWTNIGYTKEYNFIYSLNDIVDRFIIHFSEVNTNINTNKINNLYPLIKTENGNIVIINITENFGVISVYGVLGNIVYKCNIDKNEKKYINIYNQNKICFVKFNNNIINYTTPILLEE